MCVFPGGHGAAGGRGLGVLRPQHHRGGLQRERGGAGQRLLRGRSQPGSSCVPALHHLPHPLHR